MRCISLVSTAGGGQFVVFVVFVVIAVVVNVLKKLAASQLEDGGTAQGGGQRPFSAPEDELQKFLETIAGAQATPAPAPPPVPARHAVPPPLPQNLAAAPSAKARTTSVQGTLRQQTRHLGAPARRVTGRTSAYRQERRVSAVIPAMKWNRSSLQRAIMMNEILGLPVALRSASAAQKPGIQ